MKCNNYNQKKCVSCDLLDISLEKMIEKKERRLKEVFTDLEETKILPSFFLEDSKNSRYKAKFAVEFSEDEIKFGIVDEKLNFTKLEDCPLHAKGINELLSLLKELIPKYNINPYQIRERKGELKFVIISKSFGGDSILVRFILRSKESLDRLKKLSYDLIKKNNSVKVVTANIQPVHQAILEGNEEVVLSEEDAIVHCLGEFKFYLGARSFFQVTPEVAQKLYENFSLMIKDDAPSSVLDLFCGVGTFSHYASILNSKVIGVEVSKEAIGFANKNLETNLLDKKKIKYISMDAERFLSESKDIFDAIIVNPPRRGLTSKMIGVINEILPKYFYYSSCNIETLARDYLELKKNYEVVSAQIFDMFPNTSHFETLVRFKLKS